MFETLCDGVRQSYVARDLTEEQIASLCQIAEELSFAQNDIIVRQFDQDADLYIVLEGKVSILASNGDPVAKIKAGGVFGEISLIDERPRSATVEAELPTRVVRLPSDKLRELLDASSDLSGKIHKNIARMLCERLRSANVQIEALLLAAGVDI